MRRLILLSLVALVAARYVDNAREKRDVEYHDWLTDAQKSELKALKESADGAALKKRTMELYELLPSEEKEKWNKKYKEMCVAWVKEVATEEETANYKKWKAEGKMDEITGQYKKLKERLSEEKRKDVELWEGECWNLWKDEFPAASRGRRAVMELAEEKLAFLGAEKIAELKTLKEAGASDDVIRDKVVTWTLEHWKSKDSTVSTADFVKKCYGWIKDVTQAEEYEAFEKLHHTDHEACRVKVREFLSRLPAEKQKEVEKSLPLCDAIWYKQHQEEHGAHAGHGDHDHHAHKHHVKRHLNTMHIDKFMSWLTPEQKAKIHELEEGGESYEQLLHKMKEWYKALEGDKREEVRELLKGKCAEWVYSKTNEEEKAELHEFIRMADKEGLIEFLKKPYAKLSEEEKHEVDHSKDMCLAIWTTAPDRKRRDHSHHEEYKEYFTWLNEEQQAEVKTLRDAGKHEEVYKKTMEYWDGLVGDKKVEATEKMKGACRHYFKGAFGEAAVEEVKALKESGASMDDIGKKVEEFISKISDEKKREVASKASVNCKKIFSASRKRRDEPDQYAAYKQYFTWLTPEQAAEIRTLKEAKDEDGINDKIHEYFNALVGDKKVEASEKLKGACKHFFKDVFGEAATEELKALKESGSSIDAIAEKVNELIGKITDEKKKAVAGRASANCKKYFSASRKRRAEHDPHEEYKEYFSWLTPEQGAELKTLRDAHKHDEAYAKTLDFLEALSGDKKTEATEKLKGACKHYFKRAFGDEAVEEVKALKESGASMDVIGQKVSDFIDKITDEKKKAVANRVSVNCKKVFSASRKRRAEHDHHEEYKEYFSWLTPEQGAELKALRDADKHDDAYAKTLDFLEALSGDKKTEATEKLKGACKHYFKRAFGDEAVEEVKALKESGASMDVIGQKVSDFIDKITDEKKKAVANRVSVNCKKIYGASRKRRSDPSEEYKEYFSWLTPEQGAEWKKTRDAGDEEGAYKKVEAIYDALTGDAKAEATQKLKGACKHFFNKEFGAEQVEELKKLKEAGTSLDEINTKVEEFLSKITDEKKKAKASRIAGNCKKVFSQSRKRREHKHSVDEALTDFLPWLSDEQKAEIKKLKESGADEKIGEKIMEFFDSVDASKKDEARAKLQAGCRHYLKDLIGDAAAEEMKALKETGATAGDMAVKLEAIIAAMADGADKKKAEGIAKNCKKVYGVAARKRRHEHTLEEGFTEFLPWLTDAQKAELKALKESGGQDKLGEKVLEFFETVDASKKDEARTKLQAGCKHYIKHLIGDEKAAEMKALSDAGTSPADMAVKLEGIIAALPEGADKAKAERLSKNCKKVFGVASRKRRHEHTLEEGLTEFLPWTTEEQKMELKNMKEAGSDKMGEKILEYFDALDGAKKDEARGKLQAGCRHYIKSLIGDSAAAEMKALHEAGTTPADMAVKLEEIIGKMADGEDKTKAMRMSKNCRKVYGVARMRRHEHTLEEGFSEFLPWISEEQKMELKNMKEAGAADKIGDKVIEYYESVDASKKDEARTKLQAGCRHYLKHLLGDTVSGEMKSMHESGASPAEMAKKLEEIISKMEDGEKKSKAERLSKNCRKVYGVDARKRRNIYGEYDERYQQYYNWLAEDQKEELEELKDSGEDDAILDKVSQYFKDLSDAKKEEARGQLKMGCRMRMRDLLGEQKAEEIRRMKDEGASNGEMMDKVAQFVEEMEEGCDKESARRSYKHCAKILGRQRRDNKEGGSLADYTRWLTADQRQELNAIIRSDTISSDDIYSKLFEFLEGLSGEEKKEATMQMRGACRLFRAQFLGPDQSRKLTIMRETGKKWQDIEHTLDAMIAAIEDQSKRRKAQAAMNACKSLYKSLFDQ